MKFGQVIEWKMRNISLKKSYTKCGGETVPRLKSKLSISLDQQSKVLYSLFILYVKLRAFKIYKTKLHPTYIYLIWSFSEKFKKKYTSLVIFYYLLSGCLYFLRYWTICVYNWWLTRRWHHEFWHYSYLSNQAVFSTWSKNRDKNLYILRT